jgi:hypothetical protein
MTIEGLSRSFDSSLGPMGKKLKEEFLVMARPTSSII